VTYFKIFIGWAVQHHEVSIVYREIVHVLSWTCNGDNLTFSKCYTI